MTKTDLVKEVAKKSKIAQKDVEHVLNSFFDTVKHTVKKGEKVAVIGFGNFEPVFRPGKAFKEAVATK